MRETNFIDQNREKWEEFEQIVDQNQADPNKLSDLFIQVTDDLSYARTFYPNRSVRVYLNNLAQSVFGTIYKNKRFSYKSIVRFWTVGMPRLMYLSRREMLVSLLFFSMAIAIGAFSNSQDPEFSRAILGNGYVDMTIRNIEKGDPMGVYKDMGRVEMFFYIAYNNIMVMFRMFLTGILFAVGTLGALLYNGIMIGTFHYLFYSYGLLEESMLTIWVHGTFEISTIVLAGGAGLVMGKGLVFPGTYSRMQSFQISAGRGLRIMIGITPLVILAAVLESFLTRYTEVPDIIRFGLIISMISLVVGYFIWYPWMRAMKGLIDKQEEKYHKATHVHHLRTDVIQTNGELFYDTFFFLNRSVKPLVVTALIVSLIYAALQVIAIIWLDAESFKYTGYSFWNLSNFFDYRELHYMQLANVLAIGASMFTVCYLVLKTTGKEMRLAGALSSHGYKAVIISVIINLVFFLPAFFAVVSLFFVMPVCTLILAVCMAESRGVLSGLNRAMELLNGSWGKIMLLFLVMALVCFVFYSFVSSTFIFLNVSSLSWLFQATALRDTIINAIYYFISYMGFQLFLPVLLAAVTISYFSLVELKEARALKARIAAMGSDSKIYGIKGEK